MSARSIINHDDSVPGGADTKKKNNKDTRLRWPPLTKTLLVKGDEVITFPFLEDENLKDLYLVRSLLAERPYKAGYGGTAKAWEDVAVQLRDVKHPESGDLLYGPKTLKAKTLKDRFMLYMEFVQKQDREALRRTGTDDDPVPTEIMSALEDLYSDWKSHCATGESNSQAVAAQKKRTTMLRKHHLAISRPCMVPMSSATTLIPTVLSLKKLQLRIDDYRMV